MVLTFVRRTREIIETDGIDHVTIREIARRSGYNSATLYHYFEDVDELITVSCISYLEDYCRAWAGEMKTPRPADETYLLTWQLFGEHAFRRPQVFRRLFFSEHSRPLEESAALYYELFPGPGKTIRTVVQEVLHGGAPVERELPIPVAAGSEGWVPPEDRAMIDTLAVCHFRRLLEIKCAHSETDSGELIRRQIAAVRFLLRGCAV